MTSAPLELLLIRHGESVANRDGTNEPDSPLTETGIQQAERLAPWLEANFRFSAVYSSPLIRALETAEIATRGLDLPITIKPDLREVDFDLRDLLPQYRDPLDALKSPLVSAEPLPVHYAAFTTRVTNVVSAILAEHKHGTIPIFTHGGVIATLVRGIMGAHRVSIYADNTSALLLRWQNARWYLVYSNRTDHLR